MTDVTEATLTIDELAQRVGMTVRNIRAHQSRGLLPPPQLRGRTGYYGPQHVARVELIKELQDQGFNLESIKRLIEGANGSTSEVLGFTRALRTPFEEEEPEMVSAAEMLERWGEHADPGMLRPAAELGLLRLLGGDVIEVRSPRLDRAGRELAALGLPAGTGLEVMRTVRQHAEGIAQAYVRLFLEGVWKPFEEAGRPEERWGEVREALERLRPLAAESLLAIFGIVMTEATEEALGRELDRLGQG